MSKRVRELMYKYRERFGETFPLMMCMDMTDEEIESRLEDCLKSGKPYEGIQGVAY